MSVKICGYCKERVDAPKAQRVDFAIENGTKNVAVWFCSVHCCFWAGSKHMRSGFATNLKGLRELFGAAVEVVK